MEIINIEIFFHLILVFIIIIISYRSKIIFKYWEYSTIRFCLDFTKLIMI